MRTLNYGSLADSPPLLPTFVFGLVNYSCIIKNPLNYNNFVAPYILGYS